MWCIRGFSSLISTTRIRHAEGQGPRLVARRAQAREPREMHGAQDRGWRQAIQRRRGGRARRQGPPRRAAGFRETCDIPLCGFKISAEVHAAALSTVCDEAMHAFTPETTVITFLLCHMESI